MEQSVNILITHKQQLRIWLAGMALMLSACASPSPQAPTDEHAAIRLRYIGEQRIPHRHMYRQTMVGGLSGLDYDTASDTWVMVSDDRSDINPARFYTARLDYDARQVGAVTFTGVHFFGQPNGVPYPNATQLPSAGGIVPDIETIRFDPADGTLWYASEGRSASAGSAFVRQANRHGTYQSALPLPAMFDASDGQGVRDNLSFEAMSFAPDGASLWLATEAPLRQDGPLATVSGTALSRITQFDRSGRMLAQYAYRMDAIPVPVPAGRLADNGVAEILAVSDRQLLVLERSGVQGDDGVFRFHIRLYAADLRGATDIRDVPSLSATFHAPVRKRLVLDFSGGTVPGLTHIDNLEGIAWGRTLPNGNRSLVLVSDDNFHTSQQTQLLVFEVLPGD